MELKGIGWEGVDRIEVPSLYDSMILKWNLKKLDGRMLTGFIWLRIGTQ
jgi:hypothetical protein